MMDSMTKAEVESAAYSPEHLKKRAPVQGFARGIPWAMHLEAYDAYCNRHGAQVEIIDLKGHGCRGGFSTGELDMFIPGWRDRLEAMEGMRVELDAANLRADKAEARIARASALTETWRERKTENMKSLGATAWFDAKEECSDELDAALKENAK